MLTTVLLVAVAAALAYVGGVATNRGLVRFYRRAWHEARALAEHAVLQPDENAGRDDSGLPPGWRVEAHKTTGIWTNGDLADKRFDGITMRVTSPAGTTWKVRVDHDRAVLPTTVRDFERQLLAYRERAVAVAHGLAKANAC
jgi:hypothetical protein